MLATLEEDFPVVREIAGYVSAGRAAEMLNMTLSQVYWLIHTKKVKATRFERGVWLISKRSVERYKAYRESPRPPTFHY